MREAFGITDLLSPIIQVTSQDMTDGREPRVLADARRLCRKSCCEGFFGAFSIVFRASNPEVFSVVEDDPDVFVGAGPETGWLCFSW